MTFGSDASSRNTLRHNLEVTFLEFASTKSLLSIEATLEMLPNEGRQVLQA